MIHLVNDANDVWQKLQSTIPQSIEHVAVSI